MHRSSKVLIAAVAALFMVGGVAFAAWLASGTGSGAAKAGKVTIEVGAGQVTVGDLYPGGSGDLNLSVTNTSTVPLVVTGVAKNGDITSDEIGCPGGTVTFADQTSLTSPSLPVSTDAVPFTLTDAVSMAANAPTECQDAVFTIPVTVTAETP